MFLLKKKTKFILKLFNHTNDCYKLLEQADKNKIFHKASASLFYR